MYTYTYIYTHNIILIKLDSKPPKLAEINQEVRQGCPLSPILFHICLDEIITKWYKEDINEFPSPKISNC
jgi:hypothetical protein